MRDLRKVPIAPIDVFLPARAHDGVIPEAGAIGSEPRPRRCATAGRQPPPTEAEQTAERSLRRHITAICARIDRHTGAPPGTAERGCFFWLWPPVDGLDTAVLQQLRADAASMLRSITRSATDHHQPEGEPNR